MTDHEFNKRCAEEDGWTFVKDDGWHSPGESPDTEIPFAFPLDYAHSVKGMLRVCEKKGFWIRITLHYTDLGNDKAEPQYIVRIDNGDIFVVGPASNLTTALRKAMEEVFSA